MARHYIPSVKGTGVIDVGTSGYNAPTPHIQSMINKPNQAMNAIQPPPQNFIQGEEWLVVHELANQLATMATVQTIPVLQPANQLQAPRRVWNRLGGTSYYTGRFDRYPLVGLTAPSRLQSIIGYVVTQAETTIGSTFNSTLATQYQGLKAPKLNTKKGGTC